MDGWLANHRGPFKFLVTRTDDKSKTGHSSEWLKGEVQKDDVPDEASALLTDPRDTICHVWVWSETEAQFVGGYKRDARTPDQIRQCA